MEKTLSLTPTAALVAELVAAEAISVYELVAAEAFSVYEDCSGLEVESSLVPVGAVVVSVSLVSVAVCGSRWVSALVSSAVDMISNRD